MPVGIRQNIFQQMFGVKTPSLTSLVSRQWSTSELTAGMEHLLTDMRNEMPDEVAHLEAHHHAADQSKESVEKLPRQRMWFTQAMSCCSVLWKLCDFSKLW